MQKLKIALFDASSEWTGGAKRVLSTAYHLTLRGHKVIIVCLNKSDLFYKSYKKKLLIKKINVLNDLDIITFFRIFFFLKKNKIEIIDIYSPHFYFLASLAGKLAKVKKIILTRNCYFLKRKKLEIFFHKLLYHKLIDIIITVSYSIKKALIENFDIKEEKIKVIYSGIDFKEFKCKDKDKIKEEFKLGNSLLVGIIGRLDPNKGHLYFLKAIPFILKDFPEVKFLIVGKGPFGKVLKHQVKKLNLKDKVIFTGFRDDITSILDAVILVISASISEGLGTNIIEALMMAKPVVATKTGGVSEIIIDGKTGLLIPPKNSEKIASAVTSLLTNPKKAQMLGLEGQKMVKEKFNLNTMIEKIENIYKSG